MQAMTASHGAVARGVRRPDPRGLPLPGRARGRVLRAGLGHERRRRPRARRSGRRAGRVRADGPRAEGPADRARPRRLRGAVRAGDRRRRVARSSVDGPRPRPRVLGEPRAGLRRAGGGAGPARWSSRWRRRGRFEVRTDLSIARDRRNLAVRGFSALRPADGVALHDPLRHPALRRAGDQRGRLRRRAGRGRRAERRRRRPARRGRAARGASGQRRRRAAGRLRDLHGRARGAPGAAGGPVGSARGARRGRCGPPRRGPRCRRRCRWPTPCSTSAARACSCSGSPAAISTSWPAGSTTGCTSRAARRCIRGRWSWSSGRGSSGALGATISGAGPAVLVWVRSSEAAAVAERLEREAAGWARVMALPFAAGGVEVRELRLGRER